MTDMSLSQIECSIYEYCHFSLAIRFFSSASGLRADKYLSFLTLNPAVALHFALWYPLRRNTVGKDTGVSPSSLDALRTTWQQLSTRNNWALVTDEESFLRHAKEEMNNLQDIRSPEQRMRVALMRAYSAVLYAHVRERSEQAVQEVWLAGYRLALRDRFASDQAEVLAQETVALVLAKLHAVSAPASFVFWMMRVYQTARAKELRVQNAEVPLPSREEAQAMFDQIALIEHMVLGQQLLEQIKKRLHNELETIALIRCVLGGEYPHDVAHDLGLLDYRIRVAKSRALQRLRNDAEFKRLLKDLTGDDLPDAQGDLS